MATSPSFLGLVATGILLLIFILVILYVWWYRTQSLTFYEWMVLLLLFTVAVGIHGLQHAYCETMYGFNPLVGEWRPM